MGNRSIKLPNEIQQVARRKFRMLNNSMNLNDSIIPPSNNLEKLKRDLKEYHSLHINNQWRIIFLWKNGHSYNVEIIDYH
jgi:proteic killer suppression protein